MVHPLADLEAFLQEDRRCGALDAGVEGGRVWMGYEGWVLMVRLAWLGEGTGEGFKDYADAVRAFWEELAAKLR
jgi:hypothetical protein